MLWRKVAVDVAAAFHHLCQTPQRLNVEHKTSKGRPRSFVEFGGFVHPIMFGADYSVSTRPCSPGWLLCASGIVTRQAGWWTWARVPWREERTVAAFVCRWKGLQVLTTMINHPEADIWIQPRKRFNFLIHPAHNLFTPAVGAGFPHLPALSSQWPLPHAVFLSPFTPRVIIWGRSCCNCGGCLDNALFLLEMGFFLLCGRTVNWLC